MHQLGQNYKGFVSLLGDIVCQGKSRHCSEGFQQMTCLSADCLRMFIHLMLIFTLWCNKLVLPMLGEQLCQSKRFKRRCGGNSDLTLTNTQTEPPPFYDSLGLIISRRANERRSVSLDAARRCYFRSVLLRQLLPLAGWSV